MAISTLMLQFDGVVLFALSLILIANAQLRFDHLSSTSRAILYGVAICAFWLGVHDLSIRSNVVWQFPLSRFLFDAAALTWWGHRFGTNLREHHRDQLWKANFQRLNFPLF